MRASISPPRSERHFGPASDTMPSAASVSPVARADGEHQRAGLRRSGVEPGGRSVGALDTQQRHVGRRIAAGERGFLRGAAGQHHRDLALLGQRLVGGDDEAFAPDKAGRSRAM